MQAGVAELPGKPLKEDYLNENTKCGSSHCYCCSLVKLYLILCNPVDVDRTLPGFSIHGVFQAWILESFVISFSRVLPNRLSLTNLSLTLTFKKSIFFFLLKLIFGVIYEIYIAFSSLLFYTITIILNNNNKFIHACRFVTSICWCHDSWSHIRKSYCF